ncbi:hypothetical protein AAE478_006585 [Parahypoxylon ruwenzoriense]
MGGKKRTKSPKVTNRLRDFPAWYRRLMSNPDPWHDVNPEEFDEDLSEIHESEESEDETDYESSWGDEDGEENEDCHKGCDCDGDNTDCQYQCQTSATNDQYDHLSNLGGERHARLSESESELSYQGDDADYYYELKSQRVERKRDLRDHMRREEENLRRLRELHEEKEEEVHAMRESLVKATTELKGPVKKKAKAKAKPGKGEEQRQRRPRLDLAGKQFELYSTTYLDHFLSPSLMDAHTHTPYVEFYRVVADGTWIDPATKMPLVGPDCDPFKVDGHVAYLTPDFDCHFETFSEPEDTGTETVVLESWHKEHELESEFDFEFLGDDYLLLRVKRELIINYEGERWKKILLEQSKCMDAPEVIEFVGVRYDFKKRRAEMLEQEASKRARREPSPRETYFEMCHPMGWWNQSCWEEF